MLHLQRNCLLQKLLSAGCVKGYSKLRTFMKSNYSLSGKMSERYDDAKNITKTSQTPPDGIYVQVLPVVQTCTMNPQGSDCHTKSSSDNVGSEPKILLCKWSSGDFKDRYTGLIKSLAKEEYDTLLLHQENGRSVERHDLLLQFAKSLIPSPLQNNLRDIRLVGLLRFHDPPVYDEYIYLANLVVSSCCRSSNSGNDGDKRIEFFQEEIGFGDNSCHWFSWDKIPFQEMPADDELWYPKVLQQQEMIKGSFTFGGWSEKTIKSFELHTVQEIE